MVDKKSEVKGKEDARKLVGTGVAKYLCIFLGPSPF
jgi:hypothetical protein